MGKLLQKSIKLKLEQPAVMCSGRTRVSCYYKAKSITLPLVNYFSEGNLKRMQQQIVFFKSKGKPTVVVFEDGKCITKGWEDLVIVS